MRTSIKEATKFHGHLGPYLILGILAGELAMKRLGCGKYFGLQVKVRGVDKKPKSCLVDGLQLATGATYGKGNIRKIKGSAVQILFRNLKNNKKITVNLKDSLKKKLGALEGHRDSEALAKKLATVNPLGLFIIR